ncbi:MAG TPA: hypothetical protein VFV38_46570 [Ktedonobacteraceae bacterium]|nr:hypothetical protein [Ktedonobacteraceae bacterium]
MKRKANPRRVRSAHTYSAEQPAGLHTSTTARKQETVERLRVAIASLKEKKQDITAQTIYAESGLHYSSYVRNEEAIALFRINSTHLIEQQKRIKRKRKTGGDVSPKPRDPLMSYKKPQLVLRLRETQQQLQQMSQQLAVLANTCLQRDMRVAELEAKLAELEPYRNFVEQIRLRIQHEEHDGPAKGF